ncbi:MAG: ATP-grasp domain-containing protein [Thiohalocapsa sp.]
MTRSNRVAVLVGAHHAATQFVPELRARDVECVHVRVPHPPASSMFPSVPREDFLAEVTHHGDLNETVACLGRYRPAWVIPGYEGSVELADQLADALGSPGNGIERSTARRDKFNMALAVSGRGLRVIRQFKCADPERAVAWAREENLTRTVVKPVHGSGTDSVFLCSTEASIRRRAAAVLGSRHHVGLLNEEILIQEFIDGSEYIVNTVSRNGLHRVTGVWLYHKFELPGVTAIYDWDELLDPADPVVERLSEYARGVLDALEIRHGPAHTEIMVDAAGPVLIECGARLDGLDYRPLTCRCMGVGQVEIACDAYLAPDAFLVGARSYSRLEHATNVVLITPAATTATSFDRLAQIRTLPSFVDLLLRVRPGDHLPATTDYQTAPGVVFLAHPDDDVIRKDYRRIREIQAGGLFSRSIGTAPDRFTLD